MFFLSKLFQSSKLKTVNLWLNEYVKILAERELKPKTREIKAYSYNISFYNHLFYYKKFQ